MLPRIPVCFESSKKTSYNSIERFTDLNKLKNWLSFLMVEGFRPEPIFTTALAASENDGCFKSGLKRLKNNHTDSLD